VPRRPSVLLPDFRQIDDALAPNRVSLKKEREGTPIALVRVAVRCFCRIVGRRISVITLEGPYATT